MKSGKRLKAKLFYTHFKSSGNCLEGWSALSIGDGIFKVVRKDGSSRNMAIGEEIAGQGKVTIDRDFHCLRVGKYSIQIGEQVQHGWTAKPVKISQIVDGKKKQLPGYLFTSGDNKFYGPFQVNTPVSIPDHPGLDQKIVSESKLGGVQIGEVSIPLLRKEYELRLIVMDKRESYGYEAYFNLIKPGDKANGSNGTRGVFIPASEKSPALFCETVPGDTYLYRTAQFWPATDKSGQLSKKGVVGNIRDIEKAVNERTVYSAYKDLEKTIEEVKAEIASMGEDGDAVLNDLFEEQKAMGEELALANESWEKNWFSVATGYDFALPEAKKKTHQMPEPSI